MKLTWRCVLKIVGLALALAGLICLLAGYWDKLLAGGCACKEALSKKCRGGCAEFDDYDDDLLYE
ncbi:MAG TPA: hypothetical protein IAB33_03425 [Candidatus Pelethomonas intestinigallinarum]|nr:hypothetical protein [Candidatus Pelethomonas intestinigallinarum]